MRCSVRARWGARMCSTVTSPPAGWSMSRQCPLTTARAPFAAPVMARIGHCAMWCALSTRRALRRASPKGAPPNSFAAQAPASSPSPGASGTPPGAGRARRSRHAGAPARGRTPLGRLGAGMGAVVASAPAGLADPDPVRRAQARPGVPALVDEGLQQLGPAAVETLEVLAQRPRRPAQDMGGEIATRHAGANQEPAQPRHPVQMGAALRIVPTHPGVAGVGPARRGGEPHRAQPSRGRSRPDGGPEHPRTDPHRADAHAPSRCSTPSAACPSRPAPAQARAPRRPCPAHRVPAPLRARAPAACVPRRVMPGLGQRDVALCLEHAQRLAAACALPPGRGRRADRMRHRRDRRVARGWRCLDELRCRAHRELGQDRSASGARLDSAPPCRARWRSGFMKFSEQMWGTGRPNLRALHCTNMGRTC